LRVGPTDNYQSFSLQKRAINNIKNDDQECFRWAFTRALHPGKSNFVRVTKLLKRPAEENDWSGTTFPTRVSDIGIFEKNNSTNINVFSFDD